MCSVTKLRREAVVEKLVKTQQASLVKPIDAVYTPK